MVPGKNGQPRVLLTNCLNTAFPGWEDNQLNALLSSQLRSQGIFGFYPRAITLGLYVIAENLPASTTILDFPPEQQFVDELKTGYDYLGIQVIATNIEVVAKMVKIAKEVAPGTKIVLGGYGVGALTNKLGHDPGGCAEYLRETADYICSGDGTKFFRNLLGADVDAPITQHYIPFNEQSIMGLGLAHKNKIASVLSALGCPNACEFCATSAFYDRQKCRIATPEQLVDYMQSAVRRLGRRKAPFVVVYDEDYLKDPDYVRRVGQLLRDRGLYEHVNIFCFASISSISQFSMEEIVENGIGTLFIGLESKLIDEDPGQYDNVARKRAGKDVTEVFADIRRHGILTVVSTVFGWDFHTKENIETDVEFLMSLKSPFYQIAPLTPYPGTPLFKKLTEEDRMRDDFEWQDVCFWNADIFKVAGFEKGEVRAKINDTYERIYQANGPSVLSTADIMVEGYKTLSKLSNPTLQLRAKRLRFFADSIRKMFYTMRQFAPNDKVRDRIDEVDQKCEECFGKPSAFDNAVSKIIHRIVSKEHRKRSKKENLGISVEIPWVKTVYPGNGKKPKVTNGDAVGHWLHDAVSIVLTNM
jgi:haloalkane dehalogenase